MRLPFLSDVLGRRLPPLARRLDWLIAPAGGKDQLDGLPRLLGRFPAKHLLWAGQPVGSRPALDLGEILAEAGTTSLTTQAGQSLELGSGAALHVLSADEGGALLLIEWENFHALLPVGQEVPALEPLPPGLVPVDVLLLSDSGQTRPRAHRNGSTGWTRWSCSTQGRSLAGQTLGYRRLCRAATC